MSLKKIVIVAGEASGDSIGEGLVKIIKTKYPDCEIRGMGGDKMISAGLEPWGHIDQLSVMGIYEVLSKLPSILKLRNNLFKKIKIFKPDIYIGIDAPDFNLGLEQKLKKIKKLNIKTIHYVSPSIWAWKPWRIKKIKKATDSVLCVFPFEPEIYQKARHRAVYIGHPLAEAMDFKVPRENIINSLGLELNKNTNKIYIGLLPGSRAFEIKNLLPEFLKAAELFKQKYPHAEFLIPLARENLRGLVQKYLNQIPSTPSKSDLFKSIYLFSGQSQKILQISTAALLASGTITLEAALLNTPSVITYKLSKISYWIGKKLIKLSYIGLPNILLNKLVFPELLQEQVNAENLFNYLDKIYQKSFQNFSQNSEGFLYDFAKELREKLILNSNQKALEEIECVIGK